MANRLNAITAYRPRIELDKAADPERFMELITQRTTLSPGVVKNVQESEIETLIGLLLEGRPVHTGAGIGVGLLAAGAVAVGVTIGLPVAAAGIVTLAVGLGLGLFFNAVVNPWLGQQITGQAGVNATDIQIYGSKV